MALKKDVLEWAAGPGNLGTWDGRAVFFCAHIFWTVMISMWNSWNLIGGDIYGLWNIYGNYMENIWKTDWWWLEPWNFMTFHILGMHSNPNWRSHIFQMGRYTTNQKLMIWTLPSGKHTKICGKIHPFLMGKLTISMAICNSCVCLPEAMNGWILLLPFGTLCTNPRKSQVGGPDSIVDHMMYGSRVWGPVFVGNKPTVWATANSCRWWCVQIYWLTPRRSWWTW